MPAIDLNLSISPEEAIKRIENAAIRVPYPMRGFPYSSDYKGQVLMANQVFKNGVIGLHLATRLMGGFDGRIQATPTGCHLQGGFYQRAGLQGLVIFLALVSCFVFDEMLAASGLWFMLLSDGIVIFWWRHCEQEKVVIMKFINDLFEDVRI